MALGFMRRHRRWLLVFLWLVILAFVALYIPTLVQDADTGTPGEVLAEVGGRPITVGEFQREYRKQIADYERMSSQPLSRDLLRRLGVPEQVLKNLIDSRIVSLEAERLGLKISDDKLAELILAQFQHEGKFMGVEEIKRRLQLQGISTQEFEAAIRSFLLRERLQAVVTDGIAVTDQDAEQEYRRRQEQVRAEFALVDAARFRASLAASDGKEK